MEKTELRKQVIDFIVIYLSPKGEMIRKSELNQEVRKKLGGDFTSNPQWNLFYDSVIADMTSEANDVILIQGKNLIGLSDLGREMAEAGGYFKYKSMRQVKKTANIIITWIYYLSAIIVALSTINAIHFSKAHEVPVPSIWFILACGLIGSLIRDAIRYLPILLSLLFRSKR